MEDLTGREFGPYRIVAPLGEGGMASVYKAFQANMDRYVALKVLPQHFANDPQFVARFEQEAKVLAKLGHPHILPVHDYGEKDGYTYLVMPFIDSGTLVNVMGKEPLPLKKIERFISQVGDALDYAHSQGIIHRDVKPSNVLLDERENCMLVDFGIAKMVEGSANLTQTGGVLGTPAYMAPEQGRGEATDHRIDIYALGVILYEMATGRVPFKAETPIAVLVKHINDPLPMPTQVNPNLPESVEQVILKAMAKRPDDRYATAGEMVEALSAAVAGQPVASASETTDQTMLHSKPKPTVTDNGEPAETPKQKVPVFIWLLGFVGLGVAILLVIACAALLFFSGDSGTTASSDMPGQDSASSEVSLGNEPPTPETSNRVEEEVAEEESVQEESASESESSPGNEENLSGDEPSQPINTEPTPTHTPEPTQTPRPTATPRPTPTPGVASRVMAFGSEGIGPGQFTDARSVAVDNNTGNIYVGEYIGGRIQVFDENGKFLTQWLVDTEMPLRGMDADRSGNVYIVQSGLIYKYNGETGEMVEEIPYEPGWGFDDIVVSPDGGFVSPWSGDEIVRFNAQGRPTLNIPEAISGQTGDSELDTRVAVDGLGNIYALGTFNEAVLKFGPDGKFIDLFGSGGDGPGTLDSPMAIAVDGQGRVYVSELVGPIKIFDSGGQYIDSITIQALGMRFDDNGDLYVAARTGVVKYDVNLP